jgi:alpha-tubulin suppressor-like RCC1 family protein
VTFQSSSPVRTIGVGAFSSFAVTEDNTTFGWGYNEGNELGLGEGYSRNSPQSIHALKDTSITSIVCGAYHTFAVDSDRRVYGWGSNSYGQLGLGHTDEVLTPALIAGMPRVLLPSSKPYGLRTFSAGNFHSALVAENGTLFVWGRNSFGQLGLGKEWLVVTKPTALPALRQNPAKGVVAAASHTLAIAEHA